MKCWHTIDQMHVVNDQIFSLSLPLNLLPVWNNNILFTVIFWQDNLLEIQFNLTKSMFSFYSGEENVNLYL